MPTGATKIALHLRFKNEEFSSTKDKKFKMQQKIQYNLNDPNPTGSREIHHSKETIYMQKNRRCIYVDRLRITGYVYSCVQLHTRNVSIVRDRTVLMYAMCEKFFFSSKKAQ